MAVFLPHSNPIFYNNITCCFSQNIVDMNSLNYIFFGNRCSFFPLIQQYYPAEAFEFLKIYKYLQQLALNIGNILPQSLKFLQQMDTFNTIKLTRRQVALLFMLSFFGVIPQSFNNKLNYFDVSQVLYAKNGTKFEFARCFLNYLTIIGKWISQNNSILEEQIIYVREFINKNSWNLGNMNLINLCQVNFITHGSLTEGNASYVVDFANKKIGGGTLTGGCVQEEILFATQPEAIVAMLFMEEMSDLDAIGIFNTIKYSNYQGYQNSFSYNGSCINNWNSNIQRYRIIAIDASTNDKQLNMVDNITYQNIINRDIFKALAGFYLINSEMNFVKSIATGNWGCGVYNGIHELKFIEQWIAASFAGVQRLDYYTFNNQEMQNAIQCYEFIKTKFSASGLYRALIYNKLDMNNLIQILVNGQFQ